MTVGGIPTTAITHTYSGNATTTGVTKTLNIGTGGASGSTTAITLGSSTSGAINSIRLNTTPASDATGDIYYRNSSGFLNRLGIGSTGQVLTVASGLPSWAAAGGGSGWGLTGNTGLSSSTNFVGNIDNIDFNVRVNNFLVAKWNTTDGVSIGSGASVSGQASVALGVNALNSGIAAIALGYQASVGGANNAIALGRLSQSNNTGSFTSQDFSGSNVFTSNVDHQWKTKFNGGYRLMTGTAVPVELIKAGVDAGKALEVVSTTAMFIPPVMTGTQAEAISPKTEGGMIYSTDGSGVTIISKGWWGWNGTTWEKLNP